MSQTDQQPQSWSQAAMLVAVKIADRDTFVSIFAIGLFAVIIWWGIERFAVHDQARIEVSKEGNIVTSQLADAINDLTNAAQIEHKDRMTATEELTQAIRDRDRSITLLSEVLKEIKYELQANNK